MHYYSTNSVVLVHFIFAPKLLVLAVTIIIKTVVIPSLFIIDLVLTEPSVTKVAKVTFISAVTNTIHSILQSYLSYLSY